MNNAASKEEKGDGKTPTPQLELRQGIVISIAIMVVGGLISGDEEKSTDQTIITEETQEPEKNSFH